MKYSSYIKKAVFITFMVMSMQFVYAAFSFTGLAGEKERRQKISLKNLSELSSKAISLSSVRATLQFKGVQQTSTKASSNGIELTSQLRYENGNTTFVYPYKFKIKIPKFKTPSPQQ